MNFLAAVSTLTRITVVAPPASPWSVATTAEVGTRLIPGLTDTAAWRRPRFTTWAIPVWRTTGAPAVGRRVGHSVVDDLGDREWVLAAWSPAMLDEAVAVGRGDAVAHLTRRSVLLRLITHEAYHVGEIAVIRGIHGRPQIDLWRPGYHTVEAAAARHPR